MEADATVGSVSKRPLLQVHGAVVSRGGKPILSIDDLTLAEGEHMAVLGPNGCGKSTFVGLLTREVLPLYREDPPVRFRGNPRATTAEVKQYLGIVSATMQDQISVHVPALEIVVGGLLGTLGVPARCSVSQQAWDQGRAVMERLGIDDLADRDVLTLSSGQARRVLIARALVHDPKVLVLDEPCTGLDPAGMYVIRKTMRQLAHEGKGLVLVTHYPEDIIPEINRVLMLKQGAVFAQGSKVDLLDSSTVSRLFDAPLRIVEDDAWYSLVTRC